MEEWNEIQHIGCDSNVLYTRMRNNQKRKWRNEYLWKTMKVLIVIKSMLEFETNIILYVSIRFKMILQTSLTIILSTVIVYCLVTAGIR